MTQRAELPVGFEDLRGKAFQARYELDELVRVSSRHVTYAGNDRKTDRKIVLDLVRPIALRDHATLERFERRIAACRRVEHPAVHVPIDFGEVVDGKLYVVSERPAGEPLDQHLRLHPPGRFLWADARPLLLELVRGLATVHARGVVHGMLSPGCCWINRPDFGMPSLRVLDLGLNTDPSADEAMLARSRTTPLGRDAVFAAPETAGGVLGDERSDIYLLGLLAWVMLVGRPPFEGRNPFQLVGMHIATPVPAMKDVGVEVPPDVEALAGRMLAKDPAQRPAGLKEIEEAILGLDEDGCAVWTRIAEPVEAQGRRARARARKARAGMVHANGSSREAVVERLDEARPNAGRTPGRRLPGQEIVDTRWASEPVRAPARPPAAVSLPRDSINPLLSSEPAPEPLPPVEAELTPHVSAVVSATAASAVSLRTTVLSADEISELLSPDHALPSTAASMPAAVTAVPPPVTGRTERMTPAEVRALRLAALGGIPASAAEGRTEPGREPEVGPTQVLAVEESAVRGRTRAISAEQLVALRRAYEEACAKEDER